MTTKSGLIDKKCEKISFSEYTNILEDVNTSLPSIDSRGIFQLLAENARDAIIMIDNSGKVIFWNKAAESIFGYSLEEMLGKNVHNYLCSEKDRLQYESFFDHFTKTGTGSAIGNILELEGITKSGRIIPIELSLSSVKSQNGFWHAIAIIREITRRKNSEALIQRKLAIEETIASVSSMFVSPFNIDEAIDDALARMGSLCCASRSYLFQYRENRTLMDNTHEWCACGVSRQKENLQNMPSGMIPWWTQKINSGETILISNVSTLPSEAKVEKELLEMQDIKSLIVFPVVIEGEISGFIGMDNVNNIGGWDRDDISILYTIANIIGKGIEARKTEYDLKQRIDFERLITNISTDFVEISIDEIDSTIENAMGLIGSFTNSDRAYVFLFREDKNYADNTHEWCDEGISPQIKNLQGIHLSKELPFFTQTMRSHEIFYVEDVASLSFEAQLEREHFEIQGIKSLVVVPMFQEKKLTGFLGFDSVCKHRRWTENELILLQLVGENISHLLKRKESEKAIRAQAHMLDSITQAVITTDPYGKIEYMNKAAEKLYECQFNDVKGLHIAQVMRADIEPDQTAEVIKSLQEKGSWGDEIKVQRRDGNEFFANVDDTPIFSKDGQLSGIMFISYDITERKNAEHALLQSKIAAEEANRTKSEFLANMSHELRTPLNSIIGFSEALLLHRTGELSDKQVRYAKNISISGQHLLELINEILDLSKIEAGNMEFGPENISLPEVLDEVQLLMEPIAHKKSIHLRFSIEFINMEIFAEKIKVKEILYNLLSNAIKFTPENGKVRVNARKVRDKVQISVSDNGIGIPEEEQKRIFEPFKQVDSFFSREYEGTGLGLALVKQYVEMHHGTIWLESEVGKGSTFTFTIPLGKNKN
ncbi:PAS domain S-box-containing protein [Methanohalophilus levihalophilus]|uniref:PAS domain S-box protein n=1 Tax=Methanohalophilus levihalophilus TaxID=1431282 RepID=UPI001AE20232|nr:PAS domain S-box protein [Methanohalophilus levihalophilus]MBP2029656.1 PAS domain S-box-containing protein [Methanohalophilus levihalophilus]